MKRLYRPLRSLAACLLALPSLTLAQAPSWRWANSPSAVNAASFNSKVDPAGNVYLAGRYLSSATFGSTTFNALGISDDILVAKLDRNGNYQWAATGGGAGSDVATRVAINPQGEVFTAGFYELAGTTIGSTVFRFANGWFVAKLNPNGTWQWAKNVRGVRIMGLTADPAGNSYVTGSITGPTALLGSTTLTTTDHSRLFVAKLDPAGNWLWAINPTSSQTAEGEGFSLAVDRAGDVWVGGAFAGTTTFGATTLSSTTAATDAVLAKVSADGVWQTAFAVGGAGDDKISTLLVDANDHLVIDGHFPGSALVMGADTLPAQAFQNRVVARYHAGTGWQWAMPLSGRDYPGDQIAVDQAECVYAMGTYEAPLALGTGAPLPVWGDEDLYVAKFSPAGSCDWVVGAGGNRDDTGSGIGIDGSQRVYLTGSSSSMNLQFGPLSLTKNNGFSIITVALEQSLLGMPEEAAGAGFALFPNPAHHTVTLTGVTSPTADLLDATGRLVRTARLDPQTATLDLKGLAPGLYLVRTGHLTRRLVVE